MFLLKILKGKKKITLDLIGQIHKIVLKNIKKEFACVYRHGQMRIASARFIPPNYLKVPKLRDDLVKWFNKDSQSMHVIDRAALFHHKFIMIHPYYDGNGRTARLLMNLILMKREFPPVIISNTDRKKIYQRSESG